MFQPFKFGLLQFRVRIGVAADDADTQVVDQIWVPADDLCHGPYQRINPLERLNTPYEKYHLLVRRDADTHFGLSTGNGAEKIQIDPCGHYRNFVSISTIQPAHLPLLQRGGGDQAVGEAHDLTLHLNTPVAFSFPRCLGDAVFHFAQGVEHLNDWQPPDIAQIEGSPARKPIVAVYQVIIDFFTYDKVLNTPNKLGQVFEDQVLVVWTLRAGWNMDNAPKLPQTAGADARDGGAL